MVHDGRPEAVKTGIEFIRGERASAAAGVGARRRGEVKRACLEEGCGGEERVRARSVRRPNAQDLRRPSWLVGVRWGQAGKRADTEVVRERLEPTLRIRVERLDDGFDVERLRKPEL